MKPTNDELRELDRIARRYEGHMQFRRNTPQKDWHIPFEDERNTLPMDGFSIAIALIIVAFVSIYVYSL